VTPRTRTGSRRSVRLIRAKAAELVSAGATVIREEAFGSQLNHVLMQDPEGNEFCVA
jgi:Glyoxalase-like domain